MPGGHTITVRVVRNLVTNAESHDIMVQIGYNSETVMPGYSKGRRV